MGWGRCAPWPSIGGVGALRSLALNRGCGGAQRPHSTPPGPPCGAPPHPGPERLLPHIFPRHPIFFVPQSSPAPHSPMHSFPLRTPPPGRVRLLSNKESVWFLHTKLGVYKKPQGNILTILHESQERSPWNVERSTTMYNIFFRCLGCLIFIYKVFFYKGLYLLYHSFYYIKKVYQVARPPDHRIIYIYIYDVTGHMIHYYICISSDWYIYMLMDHTYIIQTLSTFHFP